MDYHSGARFKGKKVLLVGFGNSANDVSAAALFPGLRKLERSLFKDASQVCCDLWEEGAETSVVIRSPVSLVPRSLWMCTRHPVSLLLFLRKHPPLLFLLAQVLSRCFPLSVSSRGEIVRVLCAQSSRRLPTAPTGSAASSPTRSQALARAWSPGANASASIP